MYRMILDLNGLRISKPGYDVSEITDVVDFLFNTSDLSYIGCYAHGQLPMGSFAASSEENAGFSSSATYAYNLGYGKTFATPPLVLAMFENGHYGGACPIFNEANSWLETNGGITQGYGGGTLVTVQSYTSYARFEIVYSINTVQMPGPAAIAYFIAEK